MRISRKYFVASILLASGPIAFGCQYVAGIAGLEATLTDTSQESDAGPEDSGADADSGPEQCSPDTCAPYLCNDAGKGCTTGCSPPNGCADNALCITPPGTAGECKACGWMPPAGLCMTCEFCADDLCTTTCDQVDECTTNRTLDAIMGIHQRLLCKDQCNDITIACSGPSPCEIVCENGGCQNLKVICGKVGLCNLVCNGASCAGATMMCGDNACTATCDSGATITQNCGGACSCTKAGCQ